MGRTTIATHRAPGAIGPYSQAVRAGDYVFVSGQIPLEPETGRIVEGGIRAQTRQSLTNVREILAQAGGRLEHVVKTTVFLADLSQFDQMNAVYAEFFPENPPARAAIEASRLPRGALVEVEAIAYLAHDSSGKSQ